MANNLNFLEDEMAQIIDMAGVDKSASKLEAIKTEVLNAMYRSFGGGAFNYQMVDFFRNCDRFSINTQTPNSMDSGYTFITRPRLCLADESISKRDDFLPLMTNDPNSIQHAIRCNLDTVFCSKSKHSNLINYQNPFMTPVVNGCIGISGFPDPYLNTQTSDSGFHSEDQTVAIGYDRMQKTYDLSLNFRDPQNGPIMCLMFYWMLYIGYVTKGMLPAYMEDIDKQRLNYTVSIYRFVTDPSKRYIMHYGKATGCFPKSVPLGAIFNFSETERSVRSAGNFSIPFAANKIEYDDPNILLDFNTLVKRYWNPLSSIPISEANTLSMNPLDNYNGVPYVNSTNNSKIELVFKGDSKSSDNKFLKQIYKNNFGKNDFKKLVNNFKQEI